MAQVQNRRINNSQYTQQWHLKAFYIVPSTPPRPIRACEANTIKRSALFRAYDDRHERILERLLLPRISHSELRIDGYNNGVNRLSCLSASSKEVPASW